MEMSKKYWWSKHSLCMRLSWKITIVLYTFPIKNHTLLSNFPWMPIYNTVYPEIFVHALFRANPIFFQKCKFLRILILRHRKQCKIKMHREICSPPYNPSDKCVNTSVYTCIYMARAEFTSLLSINFLAKI